jgi:DNA helicase-2/ATP-dependent DNA helicase PcrA
LTNAVISGAIDLMIERDSNGEITDACVIDFKTIAGGEDPHSSDILDWENLALQVQLYARAAKDVLGKVASAGFIHLLKDNQRIEIPVDQRSLDAAVNNLEWAAKGIITEDFPMRPHPEKCRSCDFQKICAQKPERFRTDTIPLPLNIPKNATLMVGAFSLFNDGKK